jgi:hypothetical protein
LFDTFTEMLSTELRVALAPRRTYQQLFAHDTPVSWWQTLHRPATIVLFIGIVIPVMAVHRVTLWMAISAAAVWSIAPAIEYLAAICVIASVGSRKIRMARALDLWFAGHLPYSFWLLTLPVTTTAFRIPSLEVIGLTVIAPTAWTTFIVAAFCRTILGVTPAGARVRAGLHLAAFVVVSSTLFIVSAGGGVAVWSYMARRLGP